MATTYTLIEKISVGAAGASSITFTSIPQTYTDLKIVCSIRTDRASGSAGSLSMTFNGSTSSRSSRTLYGNGASAASYTDTILETGYTNQADNTASTFSNHEIYIPNYTGSNNKSASVDSVQENNATTAYALLTALLWSNTSAITSIKLESGNSPAANFVQYSTFYLYGIAKEGVTPADSSAPYATGGDSIVFDGTYWIHTFTSSGTFTPKKGLTCDYLVVAGGGGGGFDAGGGGGAGGYRHFTSQSLTNSTAYTVTVGGGGTGATTGANKGGSGSTSTFNSSNSSGGGGGGSSANTSGASGGSGGGGRANGASGGTGNSGSYSPVEGYAGGTSANPGAGSGGGGSAAVGQNSTTTTTGGNGGAATSNSITGSAVNYAGGGGGAVNNATGGGAGADASGAGAGGTNVRGAGSNATANLGGGGGGGGDTLAGGNGGSGIVIVRYAA